MNNQKSPHILNAASNLLGICFILLTSFKVFKLGANTLYDELIMVSIFLFMSSCILSFLAIRNPGRSHPRFEQTADYLFLSGLISLFIITILFAMSII